MVACAVNMVTVLSHVRFIYAAYPIRGHDLSAQASTNGIVEISDERVDATSRQGSSLARVNKIDAEYNASISAGRRDTVGALYKSSPIRKQAISVQVAANGNIEISHGFVASAHTKSSSLARRPNVLAAKISREAIRTKGDRVIPLNKSSPVRRHAFPMQATNDAVLEMSDFIPASTQSQASSLIRNMGVHKSVEMGAEQGYKQIQSVDDGEESESSSGSTTKKILLSVVILLVLLLLLIVCAIFWHRSQDHTFEDLRIAAQRALQFSLQTEENGDWRHTLNKFRELRKGKVNENHHLYSTIEAHMDEPAIQDQLQRLFSELGEGEQLLTVEKLSFMYENTFGEVTHVATGRTFMLATGCYMWLINSVGQSLTFSTFVSSLVLFLVVGCEETFITQRGENGVQDGTGDDGARSSITYFMEIHDHVAYRATFVCGK